MIMIMKMFNDNKYNKLLTLCIILANTVTTISKNIET